MRTAAPSITTFSVTALVSLRSGFWRVVHPSGRVVGYIEESSDPSSPRYAARRLVANTTRLIDLGDFWSLDDARDCFG
ncbi:hypothetical protein [Agreia sp. COWG]|uniref:hypothetical protein n=1 Tax=Agreia sp. COWG TaxID=2773266 RepID=UPI001926AF97|nr:hypothetical protein [Agreia sp. COWG]CAD5996023.1 conserved protein of unknown function [Agreia sp. COWG]